MTTTQDLGWLLANFADRVPGVAHAVAVGLRSYVSLAEGIISPPSPPTNIAETSCPSRKWP